MAVHWSHVPEPHDYPAAENYLSLLADARMVSQLAERLRAAPIVTFKAKDILRASRLPLLGRDNPHVTSDLKKVKDGQKLSPVLLLRGDLSRGLPAQIADGYHRVCASYYLDENTEIPAQIA